MEVGKEPSRERESKGELRISRSNKVMSLWTRGDDSRQGSGEVAVYLVGSAGCVVRGACMVRG